MLARSPILTALCAGLLTSAIGATPACESEREFTAGLGSDGAAAGSDCTACPGLIQLGSDGCFAVSDECGASGKCARDLGICQQSAWDDGAVCYLACGDTNAAQLAQCLGACYLDLGWCEGRRRGRTDRLSR